MGDEKQWLKEIPDFSVGVCDRFCAMDNIASVHESLGVPQRTQDSLAAR
jgi:hypothetical protein